MRDDLPSMRFCNIVCSYSLGALANLCCCREAVQLFFELDGLRHMREVVLPSKHQLAHPFALVVAAVTGAHFEGGLGLPKATLDAVNRVVDACLLPPLLVFASLPATGTQAQQVSFSAPTRSHHMPHMEAKLCADALKHMKSVRPDLPATMEEAMAMPLVVQVRAIAANAPLAAHPDLQAVTDWAKAEAETEESQ